MSHPAEGVLRRLVDEPSGVAVADRRHVESCGTCLDELAAIRRDAELVGAALATDGLAYGAVGKVTGPATNVTAINRTNLAASNSTASNSTASNITDADVAAAWRRLSAQAPAPSPSASPGGAARRRTVPARRLLRRPAAVALAFAVVLAGAGTAAANGWLQIFRAERVAPVGITTADLLALPDLSAYGELSLSAAPEIHQVVDAQAAEAETGLDVPEVDELPPGVAGDPVFQVGGTASATFTFSAAETAAAAGADAPSPPPGLNGASVRLDAGPGVLQVWTSGSGAPALVVGRAGAPRAFSSGVPFEAVRDYLLSLPGLPEKLTEQLRMFSADGSTLPLPVPADQVTTASAVIDGVPATVLTTRDGALAAVVWVQDSVVTVVAGSLDDDEVLSVARSLR